MTLIIKVFIPFLIYKIIYSNNKNISGIVIADNRCEIKDIEEASFVSRSYAAGMTIVFNPNGIESAHIVQIFNVSLILINFNIKIPSNGKIINLVIDNKYTL